MGHNGFVGIEFDLNGVFAGQRWKSLVFNFHVFCNMANNNKK